MGWGLHPGTGTPSHVPPLLWLRWRYAPGRLYPRPDFRPPQGSASSNHGAAANGGQPFLPLQSHLARRR